MELEAAAGFDGRRVRRWRRRGRGRTRSGAGDGVLDARDFFAEVEALGLRLGWVEEAAHAAAQVGGVGEVWCVFGAGAAEGEDSGLRGDGAEISSGLRCELYSVIFEVEARIAMEEIVTHSNP